MTSITVNRETITNLPGFYQVTEYTNGELFAHYAQAVSVVHALVEQEEQITDPNDLKQAILVLRFLFQNGLDGPIDPNDPNSQLKKYFLTQSMVKQMRIFFQSLLLAGIDVSNPNFGRPDFFITLQQYSVWHSLVNQSLGLDSQGEPVRFLDPLFKFVANETNRSIQAVLEMEYVGTGNDMLSDQLRGLEGAVSTTQGILNNLGNLQDYHNRVVLNNRPPFSSTYNINSATFSVAGYRSAASAYYNKTVSPEVAGFPQDALGNFVAAPILNVPPKGTGLGSFAVTSYDQYSFLDGIFRGPTISNFVTAVPKPNSDLWDIYQSDGTVLLNRKLNIDTTVFGRKPLTLVRFASPEVTSTDRFTPNIRDKYSLANHTVTLLDPSNPTDLTQPFVANANWNNVQVVVAPEDRAVTFDTVTTVSPLQGTYNQNSLQNKRTFLADYVHFGEMRQTVKDIAPPPIGPYGWFEVFGGLNVNARTKDLINYFNVEADQGITGGKFGIPFISLPSGNQWLLQDITKVTAGVNYKGVLTTRNADPEVELINGIFSTRTLLQQQLRALSATLPPGPSDASGLYSNLKTVLTDLVGFQDLTKTSPIGQIMAAVRDWILDSLETRASPTNVNAGAIQQNITFAITAAQNLNDTQKEKVRRFMFVFEEYYKSAAAILSKLTQIIERMAQSIKR